MNTIGNKSNRFALAITALLVTLFTTSAQAAEIKVGVNAMQTLVNTISGFWGTLFAALMIMLLGLGAMSGRLNKGWAVSIGIGIILIWNAAYWVSFLQNA